MGDGNLEIFFLMIANVNAEQAVAGVVAVALKDAVVGGVFDSGGGIPIAEVDRFARVEAFNRPACTRIIAPSSDSERVTIGSDYRIAAADSGRKSYSLQTCRRAGPASASRG